MKRPLISYVVTAYNIENFIRESIECAFAQTYSPLEIVLSDDASDDKTYEIMEKMVTQYKGPHKIVLNRNEINLGITQHMNKAYLNLAHGDIIIAAHGDDISLPERTEKSYEFLSTNSDHASVSFSIQAIDENGRELSKHSSKVKEIHHYTFESGGNIPAPSRAFYKRVMTEFGPLQDTCPTEDELISFRALMLGKSAFLPDIMVYYRKHNASSSNPENFYRFPLDHIYNQQVYDMNVAIQKGYVSEEICNQVRRKLFMAKEKRKVYRVYFADRSIKNLIKLLVNKNVNFKGKVHYIREHILFNNSRE